MKLLENPWFVGIVGGIISGVIVTFITRYLFSRKERKEYRQKVDTANNEIIYSIRPSIAEKIFPSIEIIDSLLFATAKKYDVDKNDLYNISTLSDDLIKEIMDNSFLSSQQKVEFCDLIKEFKESQLTRLKRDNSVSNNVTIRKFYSPEFFSALLGLIATLMILMSTFVFYLKDKSYFSFDNNDFSPIVSVIMVGTFVPVFSLLMANILKKKRETIEKLKKYKKHLEKEKQNEINESKE